MLKVLIANQQNTKFYKYLSQHDKRLEIIRTTDGFTTLNKYFEVHPHVLVLDSNFKDMNCIEILDRLSITVNEKRNCNTILTIDNNNIFFPTNVSKVYKILYTPIDMKCLSETINEIYCETQYQELDEKTLDLLLLKLKFSLNSNGTKYIKEAITQCYYYPYLLQNLDSVFDLIAKTHNISNEAVRSSFRTALIPINRYREHIQYKFLKLFDDTRNITPKYFLEIITMYLQRKNIKK